MMNLIYYDYLVFGYVLLIKQDIGQGHLVDLCRLTEDFLGFFVFAITEQPAY